MAAAEGTPPIADPRRINLSWLVRLRFGAVSGQLCTTLVVHFLMGIALPLLPLLSIIGVEFFTNLLCTFYSPGRQVVPPWLMPGLMVLDVLLLTGLLYLTGGPFNPFGFLYLVQIALAAVVLPPRSTWLLVVLSVACSGVLFISHWPLPLPSGTHDEHMRIHLQGMWVAFSVAASFIVYFLLRITRALSLREAQLAEAQKLAARQEKLASLATLAAGAAHELATPLSTIALAAGELERQIGREAAAGVPPLAIDDVRLIREQVDRCRGVLEQMAADAGQSTGESPVPVPVAELLAGAVAALGGPGTLPVQVELVGNAGSRAVRVPRRALQQALRGLLKNAQDAQRASGAGSAIVLSVACRARWLDIEVRDCGPGMPPEVLQRAGEPFFTTKPPGQGLGLGLFLTGALLDRLGGRLQLRSTPGQGTVVQVSLPL